MGHQREHTPLQEVETKFPFGHCQLGVLIHLTDILGWEDAGVGVCVSVTWSPSESVGRVTGCRPPHPFPLRVYLRQVEITPLLPTGKGE
jgi:hypothetical protein